MSTNSLPTGSLEEPFQNFLEEYIGKHSENIEEPSANILGENLETVERYPLPPTTDYHLLSRQTTHTRFTLVAVSEM